MPLPRVTARAPSVSDRRAASVAIPNVSCRIAYSGTLIALACGLVPLLGWALGQPLLAGLGFRAFPALPLNACGIALNALALFCTVRGVRSALVLPLVLMSAAIGGVLLFDGIVVPPGLGEALLPGRASALGDLAPTPTGLLGSTTLVLLSMAIALAGLRSIVPGRVAALIGSLGLGVGVLSLMLLPNARMIAPADLRFLATTFPDALATASLSIALLAWRAETGWSGVLAAASADWRLFRLIFPIILITPVLAEAMQFVVASNGLLSPVLTQLVGAGFNGIVITGLLFWGSTRLVRQRNGLQHLTHALDSAPIALTALDGRIVHWSRGCEELYGWSATEAIGQYKHDLLHSRCHLPGDRAKRPAEQSREGQELIETRRDGKTLHVLEQTRVVASAGRAPMLAVSMIDIDARVRVEAALRESEARLSLALDSHHVGIFELNRVTGDITWSQGSEHRLGFPGAAFSNRKTWAELLDPDDLATIDSDLEEVAARQGDRVGFRYRFRQAEDTMRAVEGSARCFYDDRGALVRTVGIHIDVTEREEREAALQAREAQLHSVLETAPDAIVFVDATGIIRSFSRTAEQLFGYRAEEAVGMQVGALIAGRNRRMPERFFTNMFLNDERRATGATRALTAVKADGDEMPVEVRVGEAMAGDERLFTAFIRDISERIAAEERMSTLSAELMHVSRINAMGEMAAALAHELNQPLAAIVNYMATANLLLKEENDTGRVSEMLETVGRQALRAGEIIRSLREFGSKRDTEVRAEPVEATIRDATTLVLAGHGQFDLQITYDLDPHAEFMLADRVQIQQVLVNLMRNSAEALRAVPRDRREIHLHSRLLDPTMLEVGVRDTGPGIADAVLARMYQPFTSTKGKGGMGIGLSICRRIVEAHGGELIAENRDGGGACFRFTLPRINPREVAA